MELYSGRLHKPLFLAHVLDPQTSGAMAFAKTASAAANLRQLFKERRVKRSYLFVTDRKSEKDKYEISSEINKVETRTSFQRRKRSPFFELWQANSETEEPHQIRQHAQSAGLPLLGDELYGGSRFPRLCLHSEQLVIPDFPAWSCPAPRLFERLGLLKDAELAHILNCIDRRQRLFSFLGTEEQTLRLMDVDGLNMALDLLGPNLWLHWYREQDPTALDLERWTLVSWLLRRPLIIQKRVNRGAQLGPATRWEIGEPKEKWLAIEKNEDLEIIYQLKKNQGESYGLFLDQRCNRTRLAELATGKSLLNLFAYTGGFGIVGSLSGATQTTTVDLSAVTIEWAKENFRLNKIPTVNNEFFAADCFFFLDRAIKKGRTWDLVICDPPIFSRSKDKVFRVEKDFASLISLCEQALNPGGWILFSTHYSGWNQAGLKQEIKKVFSGLILDGEVDVDFSKDQALKSFWLQKLR